ncbi:SELP, partial [Symbiodinium pilosum]
MVGDAKVMLCYDTPAHSAGYAEAQTLVAAANSSGPTCMAKACTTGLPDLLGVVDNCSGATTLQTCNLQPQLGFTFESTTLACGVDGEFTGVLPDPQAAVCPTPSFGVGVGSTCANKSVGAECWAYCLS